MTAAMEDARTLSEVLGGCKELAVFEAFALRNNHALSVKDASLLANVAWATAHRMVNEWSLRGLLDQAGKLGKANLYHLNLASPTVRALSRAVNSAVRELLEADLLAEGLPEKLFAPRVQDLQVGDKFRWAGASAPNTGSGSTLGLTRSIEATNRNTGGIEVTA